MTTEEDRLTPDQQRFYSLVENVRTMLRRNYTIMFSRLGFEMAGWRRRQMMAETEKEAEEFVLTLQALLLFMTEEEACDYLDGIKHIVTECKENGNHYE
jgi:hypothetical protein